MMFWIPELNNAVCRLIQRIDIDAICDIINEIPEVAFNKVVITNNQKKLYSEVLTYGYENVLKPTYEKLEKPHLSKTSQHYRLADIGKNAEAVSVAKDKQRTPNVEHITNKIK